jgi:hypothetical protein
VGRSRPGPGPGPGPGPTGSAAGKGAADGEREEENTARGGGGGGERWWSPEYGSIAAGGGGVRVGKVARGLVGTIECGVLACDGAQVRLVWCATCAVCVSGVAEEGSSWMGRDRLIPEQYGPQASALRGAPAGSVYYFGPGHIRVRCKPERLLSITLI